MTSRLPSRSSTFLLRLTNALVLNHPVYVYELLRSLCYTSSLLNLFPLLLVFAPDPHTGMYCFFLPYPSLTLSISIFLIPRYSARPRKFPVTLSGTPSTQRRLVLISGRANDVPLAGDDVPGIRKSFCARISSKRQ